LQGREVLHLVHQDVSVGAGETAHPQLLQFARCFGRA
jgi:hypothetical protein